MDFTAVFVFLAFFLLAYLFLSRPRNLPPGPTALPLVGSLSVIRQLKSKSAYIVFQEYAKKYGNIMSLRLGPQLVVVLSRYDVIHEALVKKADVFSDRFRQPVLRRVLGQGQGIIISDYNRSWQVLRRFTLQSLRDFGVGKTSLEEKIAVEIDTVGQNLRESEGRPVQIRSLFQKLVANIIYGIIFDLRYEYEDPKFDKVRTITDNLVQGQGLFSFTNFLPSFLVKLFNKKDWENAKNRIHAAKEMRKFFDEIIEEHEASFDSENIRDFIDFYIRSRREENSDKAGILIKENLFRVIVDLFIAGSETTYTALTWAFLLLAEHPGVQRKCVEEIEMVVGARPVKYSDRGTLVYVEATIMEILRFSSIAPTSVPHCVKTETDLRGYCIPANTIVVPNLYELCTNETVWREPGKFDPSRFVDEAGTLRKDEKHIPFSIGPRTCVGEPLARMELFLVVTNLLQRFRFERENPDVSCSLEAIPFRIVRSPLPYKLRVTCR